MNVLSTFDGMSCMQLALKKAGIPYSKYYASEVDKFAIKVTQRNFPRTIQLGDVSKIQPHHFMNQIDFLSGGSPCQGFSFAGKGLNFDDPRSKLFFEFVRLKKELNPKWFLLENVRMKKEHEQVITDLLEVEPIKINSGLVSAQNRVRLYWMNIPNITQPEDRGIYLKDILQDEHEVHDKYYLSDVALKRIEKRNYSDVKIDPDKAGTLNTKNNSAQLSTDSGTTLITHSLQPRSGKGQGGKGPLSKNDGKSYCLDTANGQVLEMIGGFKNGQYHEGRSNDYSQGNRVYTDSGKSVTLSAEGGGLGAKTGIYEVNSNIRRLTPIECERLQGVPDNYTSCVSDSQRYKQLGNGWQVDTIAHILSFM